MYPHESIYFNKEGEDELLKALKEEANKNNLKFSDYLKELIRAGRDKGIFNLPETLIQPDQSGKIKDLEEQIAKMKGDIVRLTALKDSGFDWNKILRVLNNTQYKTEFTILEEIGAISKPLFDDEDNQYQEILDSKIAELQLNLGLRAEYYKDVEYKKNQGWKLCK